MPSDWTAANWLWGYLIPIGLLLLIWGGLPKAKARRLTSLAGMASGIAIIGYWAVGFALHLGGAQAIHPEMPAVQGLDRLLLLVPGQADMGVVGLAGFFLAGTGEGAFGLFLTYLPLMITAVLLIILALFGERPWIVVTAGALTGSVLLPIAACWIWGGGWLSHTGSSLMLGHGFVDFGGTALILWLPSCIAAGILLTRKRIRQTEALTPPPTYAPLAANAGALLMGFGWVGWSLAQPFHSSGSVLSWNQSALSMLLGMAGAVLTSQLYAWLTLGSPEAVLSSRGLAVGWGAILACAPFVRPWQALIIGILSGILFPLVHYAMERQTTNRNTATVLALGLTAGPIGILSTGLFADGRWGLGWNGIDLGAVTGLIVNGSPQQLQAQLLGLVVLGVWGLFWGAVYGLVTRLQPAPEPVDNDTFTDMAAEGLMLLTSEEEPAETEITVIVTEEEAEESILDEPELENDEEI